jgi:ribose transport system substrate-binding protein
MVACRDGELLPERKRARFRVGVAVPVVLALVIAGCGSSSSSSSSTSNAASSGSTSASGGSSDVQAAKAAYEAYMGPYTWKSPGPAFDARKAAGKTVWYIGTDMSIPILQTISGQLKQALATVGVNLQICDGKGEPTQWNACATDAVDRHANAIIVESFPPQLIAGPLGRAKAAGIPVINGNNTDPTGPLSAGTDANVAFQYSKSGRLTADWVIADSNGKANVLVIATSDVPNSAAVVNDGYLAEFKAKCPGCTVTTKDIPISQWSTGLAPLTQSALTSNPNLGYIIPAYDGMSTFVDPAIQSAGKASSVKVATFNADLQPMQEMAKHNIIYVDVGSHNTYEGWAYADQALRLMTGTKPVPNEFVPIRVFTRDNVGSLQLTQAATDSGVWFGPATYVAEYKKLWGVGG